MFARVTTVGFEGAPDEAVAYVREQVLPAVQGLSGFRGLYHLVDRQRGKALGITLWETAAALRASAATAQRLRAASVGRGPSAEPAAEEYEVVLQASPEAPAP